MGKKVMLTEKEAVYITNRGGLEPLSASEVPELLSRAYVGKIVTKGLIYHLKTQKN